MARKIRLWINTGFAGATHKDIVDAPDDWDEMSEKEQEKYLDDEAQDFLGNHIDYGAAIVDDDDE